jgi:voltage-gated potassium channel Kch
VGVITNDADLFKRVEQAIAYRYTKAEPTQLAALGKANSAAQDEKDYLKALYFLLSALPEPKSSASKTITAAERDDTCASTCRLNEIQLYRTCFYKNRGKLFSFLKEHFTATKTAGASQ